MTPAARHRARIFIIGTAAAAALLGSAEHAQAADPAGTGKSAGKAPAAHAGDASYSLGVSMGDQLHAAGVPAASVNSARLAQGVHDALTGKVTLGDQDRENIRALLAEAGEANHRAAAQFLAANAKKPGVTTTASGLQYKVLSPGSGDSPKPHDEVTVNYRGTLIDGKEFDSSYKRNRPATFQVNRVIPGWTEALQLMRPGARYRLFIPPQLAYDLRSPPPIPPGSLLIFEVELLNVKPAAAAMALPAPAAQPPK